MIITLCGSTRFRAEIARVNRMLTLAGHVVLAPGVFQHDGDVLSPRQKVQLDQLHLYKIDLSDAVYVVNVGGYAGESTLNEIRYAVDAGKQVEYLVPVAVAVANALKGAL